MVIANLKDKSTKFVEGYEGAQKDLKTGLSLSEVLHNIGFVYDKTDWDKDWKEGYIQGIVDFVRSAEKP